MNATVRNVTHYLEAMDKVGNQLSIRPPDRIDEGSHECEVHVANERTLGARDEVYDTLVQRGERLGDASGVGTGRQGSRGRGSRAPPSPQLILAVVEATAALRRCA